ncbi:hypothetical protein [Bordetella sp. 2513F-2]
MSGTSFGAFFTEIRFLGIPLANWLLAAAVAIIVFLVARVAIGFVQRRLHRLAEAGGNHFVRIVADVVAGTSNTLLALAALLIGAGVLDLPERWSDRIGSLWFVVAILQVAL